MTTVQLATHFGYDLIGVQSLQTASYNLFIWFIGSSLVINFRAANLWGSSSETLVRRLFCDAQAEDQTSELRANKQDFVQVGSWNPKLFIFVTFYPFFFSPFAPYRILYCCFNFLTAKIFKVILKHLKTCSELVSLCESESEKNLRLSAVSQKLAT